MNDQELLEAFSDYQRAAGLAPNTIRSRQSALRAFARRQNVALLDATIRDLRRDLGRQTISPATRAAMRAIFIAFFNYLQVDRLRNDNPTESLPYVRVPPKRPRPYTQAQIDLLLTTGAYKRTRAMILLAAYQGLRVSEIAAVHSGDVDLRSGTLKVTGKGGRTDYLPLHSVIESLASTMPTGWWFPARRGHDGHIRGRSVSDLLRLARQRAGISDTTLTGHSLRHAFGTELVRGGANIRAVQELMRHESLQTTQLYAQVLDDDRRAALAVLPSRSVPVRSGR
ncbi:tyrosine-type recombinase/integrase [Microbacterium saperdae]|uniref:Integrase/recombinase XerD n=1 Tax=Microbacterium saperdae TaxID=69368 RepID=A0A543BQS7_9MICO|nr:tyrosine-type recombinase/integrase [Microbacterium saperdae]TQL87183.1 integrase/recombinase XerD [Microbacterium saperdae]GGM42296.1 tyrosine recombinase XerD [Microbacterium saperdae]